jgi:hypothetical protein
MASAADGKAVSVSGCTWHACSTAETLDKYGMSVYGSRKGASAQAIYTAVGHAVFGGPAPFSPLAQSPLCPETRVAGAALQAWCGLWHAVRPGRLVRVVGLRREPLVAFLKAYKRGSQWMLDHPDEAAQLAVKHAIDGKDPQRKLAIIKLRNAATVDEHTR